jgi:transposase
MRDDDGRKLDHKTLEQLRIRAVRQIEQGAHPEEIAQALGMTRAAVYGWLAKYREGGLEALKARPVPGRPPTLSGSQLQRIYTLVVGNDPRQLPFTFALWTRAMVRELIGREFAVRLSEVSVGRLLPKLGLSPQRPLDRAYQQNPEAVARWNAETYPAICAEAARVGATVYLVDEAGVRSDDHAGTTWAPVGQTPVVATTGDRFAVNLISAVTAKGKLRFAAYDGQLERPGVHRLLPPAAPRHPGPGVSGLGRSSGAPLQGRQAVRRLHEWAVALVLPARVCAGVEPG